MGFRLIREHSQEYKEKFGSLKKKQLETETERWSNLTTHSSEDRRHFLDHFEEVHDRAQQASSRLEDLLGTLCLAIKQQELNIANVQGNMEIDRLRELLDEV